MKTENNINYFGNTDTVATLAFDLHFHSSCVVSCFAHVYVSVCAYSLLESHSFSLVQSMVQHGHPRHCNLQYVLMPRLLEYRPQDLIGQIHRYSILQKKTTIQIAIDNFAFNCAIIRILFCPFYGPHGLGFDQVAGAHADRSNCQTEIDIGNASLRKTITLPRMPRTTLQLCQFPSGAYWWPTCSTSSPTMPAARAAAAAPRSQAEPSPWERPARRRSRTRPHVLHRQRGGVGGVGAIARGFVP